VLTGNMASARECHTATRLTNGKVLVTGGGNGSVLGFSSTELFDPATGSFSGTQDMGTPRDEHTATLLTNGNVLIAGGINSDNAAGLNSLAIAELYP
jgi:Galactose oxidase, central domain